IRLDDPFPGPELTEHDTALDLVDDALPALGVRDRSPRRRPLRCASRCLHRVHCLTAFSIRLSAIGPMPLGMPLMSGRGRLDAHGRPRPHIRTDFSSLY